MLKRSCIGIEKKKTTKIATEIGALFYPYDILLHPALPFRL